MMDNQTRASYNKNAKSITEKQLAQNPKTIHDLATTFFHKNEKTLDLGSGSGRDTHWLAQNTYQVTGIDFSEGMLTLARKNFPKLEFKQDELPYLKTLNPNEYRNILCSAVLQHVDRSLLLESIRNILRIAAPNARIIVSFRSTKSPDLREDGKLYENYNLNQLAQVFESFGAKILYQKSEKDFDSDLEWHTLVVEKINLDAKSGISRIQDIIQRDKKTATYKFALLRALCEISRYEQHVVKWSELTDTVTIPVDRIAVRWLSYYFPLIKNNIKQSTSKQLAFESGIKKLDYNKADLFLFLKDLESTTGGELAKLVKSVSQTIITGPIKHSGSENNPIFSHAKGNIHIPADVYRDISQFSHWIEDSLILQWTYMTVELNKTEKQGAIINGAKYLEFHTVNFFEPQRDTYEIRKLFKNKDLKCVWTGKALKEFHVDHMIPWSVWHNNDIWNLLPADPKTNSKKSNYLPSDKKIENSFERIKNVWEIYAENFEDLFKRQMKYSLGIEGGAAFTSEGKEALIHTLQRIHIRQGVSFW